MANLVLTPTRFHAGRWEGVLEGAGKIAPVIEVRHLDRMLEGVEVVQTAGTKGGWAVSIPVLADCLGDGVQSFVIQTQEGEVLGRFSIAAGTALAEDLRAEVDLLRQELDLLKAAFRRHCAETT